MIQTSISEITLKAIQYIVAMSTGIALLIAVAVVIIAVFLKDSQVECNFQILPNATVFVVSGNLFGLLWPQMH